MGFNDICLFISFLTDQTWVTMSLISSACDASFENQEQSDEEKKNLKVFLARHEKDIRNFFLLTKVERQLADKMVQQILAAANKWTEH